MWKLIDKYRRYSLVWITHSLALPFARCVKGPSKFPYGLADLEHFAEGTVGADLSCLLKQHGYKLIEHYELHDVKHMLLQYGFTEEEEVQMQFYFLAQGVWTVPAWGSVIAGMLLLPEYLRQYIAAYRCGKHALVRPDWESPALLHQSTAYWQHCLCRSY